MNENNQLPLRIGVGIVLLNHENNIFVGKRIDNPQNSWQMPQGGVDQNEDFLQAARRELEEETGIKSVKLIKALDGWLNYDLPENLLGKLWNGKYRGQKQKWFVMKFLGKTDEINVKTKNPEFFDWKWIKPSELTKIAVNFKVDIYKKIKEELSSLNIN
jgi:putative (di)nucleoside polyphosphate hydrolase